MEKLTKNEEKITNYTHYIVLPLKFVGCWDWYPNPTKEYQIIINNVYLCFVLFVLSSLSMALFVHLFTGSDNNMMENLLNLADGLPVIASVFIVAYFASNKEKLYELVDFMNANFKYYSAKGLTNMTMRQSYVKAKNFAKFYTACCFFSVSNYVMLPVILHLWTKQPIMLWVYKDVSRAPFIFLVFLRLAVTQALVGLAVGQLGVFFAVNSILLCGQYDLLCCSLRNARYTALLRQGVPHAALARAFAGVTDDEMHNYVYSKAQMTESDFHYDGKVIDHFAGKIMQFDIYNPSFDEATCQALRDCARVAQVNAECRVRFERFISPLLALRVIQEFDMVTAEYLVAVALDIFLYCYFANQIIVQAGRVSTAAYSGAWTAMGGRPRRLLLNILLACKKPVAVRAGRFLPMDLRTFVAIIKTSFSYYTLLVNVNEQKNK